MSGHFAKGLPGGRKDCILMRTVLPPADGRIDEKWINVEHVMKRATYRKFGGESHPRPEQIGELGGRDFSGGFIVLDFSVTDGWFAENCSCSFAAQ